MTSLSHRITRMPSISLVFFVSRIYIIGESLKHDTHLYHRRITRTATLKHTRIATLKHTRKIHSNSNTLKRIPTLEHNTGTVGGIGLSLGFGVSLNATTINVLPFLMLGLGVDDMFIFHRTLMQFRERSDVKQMSPEDQVAAVLREAGPCVCLTTFTNFCAFMIGTLTPLPVVRDFALTASITVIVSWFTNLVGFNALCVLSLKHTPDLSLSNSICGSSNDFSFASWSKNIVETKISPFLTNTMTRVITVIFFIGLWGLSGYDFLFFFTYFDRRTEPTKCFIFNIQVRYFRN